MHFFINKIPVVSLQLLLQRRQQLPAQTDVSQNPVACVNCYSINKISHNFCTNCGYPLHPNDENITDYNNKLNIKKEFIYTCKYKILLARNTLYVISAFGLVGIFYIFSSYKHIASKGFLMVLLGLLYAGLARWSVKKPFTAMLIGLIMTITFVAINTWSSFSSSSFSMYSIILLFVQIGLIYILLQGVKGAFHADILEEELKY